MIPIFGPTRLIAKYRYLFGRERGSQTIADQLRAKLTGREEQVVASKPTDNSQAYDAYLRAWHIH